VTKMLTALRRRLPAGLDVQVAFDHSQAVPGAPAEQGLLIRVRFPAESSLSQVEERLQQCEARLKGHAAVAGLLAIVSSSPGQLPDEATLLVRLSPEAKRGQGLDELVRKVRADLASFPGLRVAVSDLAAFRATPPRGYPVDLVLSGPDRTKVVRWAEGMRK